ncbi:hypothetical protein H1C71_025841 [Ictidomys tridecemlineatus]|nr:hypothetical protein H1C71_025841 [Ictidomys tridecemlineatus]
MEIISWPSTEKHPHPIQQPPVPCSTQPQSQRGRGLSLWSAALYPAASLFLLSPLGMGEGDWQSTHPARSPACAPGELALPQWVQVREMPAKSFAPRPGHAQGREEAVGSPLEQLGVPGRSRAGG